jgi:hypothetical protein
MTASLLYNFPNPHAAMGVLNGSYDEEVSEPTLEKANVRVKPLKVHKSTIVQCLAASGQVLLLFSSA